VIGAITRAHDRVAPETRGMLAVLVAMLCFTSMDSCAKLLLENHHTVQVVWARYTGQTVLLLLIFAPSLGRRLRTRHLPIQLARSALLFTATSLFFTALGLMPLAEAVAVFEVAPLIITVLGAVVLGEQVGPRRWAGVIVGLCGALIIIRPGMDVFQPAALLPLAAATCMACYQIATRFLGAADPIWTTMLYTAGVGTLVASLAVPFYWTAPQGIDILVMVGFGSLGFAGHLALVYGLGQAPASALAPFNYAGFVWALLLGFLWFGEVPDGVTFLGAAVIICAGLYVWHRERVRAAPPSAAPGGERR
jgi:drug/metabolite transporter (DMT)-like permease